MKISTVEVGGEGGAEGGLQGGENKSQLAMPYTGVVGCWVGVIVDGC